MAEGLIYGILLGLALGLSTGPAFFILLSATVQGNRESGLWASAGMVDSDLLMALMSLLGVGFVKSIQDYEAQAALIGGVVLIGAGFFSLFKKPDNREEGAPVLGSGLAIYSRVFLVNIINPLNWLFWLTVCAWIQVRGGGTLGWWVLVPAFVIQLGLNLLKVELIVRWGRAFLENKLFWLRLIVSFSLLGFGIYLVTRGL
ncbi:MAG: LysE family translocator [Bacteroidales bacterium]